jgi:hypothetical protein
MKRPSYRSGRQSRFGLALALFSVVTLPATACTVFVLTDTNRVLFCNNEDGPSGETRIWFVPAGLKHYGAVYVGYDNGWAQGGLNTEGLAFDWVAGYKEAWDPEPSLPTVVRNERVLETCSTVDEAVTFYRKHHELSFNYAKILLADRTGASVIIGAKNGKLEVEQSKHCRGFGYGARTLDKMLASSAEPDVANGARILRACLQQGQYATRYFNIFDLKTCDIFLFTSPERDDPAKFNLPAELRKGAHYLDMSHIREQLTQAPRPLLDNMKHPRLEECQSIPDQEPKVTAHVRRMLQDVIDGTPHIDDFTAEAWSEAAPALRDMQAQLKTFGPFVSATLVARGKQDALRWYCYRMEFEKRTVLQRFVFDAQDKLASSQTEDIR